MEKNNSAIIVEHQFDANFDRGIIPIAIRLPEYPTDLMGACPTLCTWILAVERANRYTGSGNLVSLSYRGKHKI